MGDTKRIRKKYTTPNHPWNRERIEVEKKYRRTYGLTTKKEIWKAESVLKNFKNQIKKFPSLPIDQAQILEEQIRGRLHRLGLITEETPLGEVLGFDTEKILDRRLQTVLLKKGLARTPKQARQMIIHEHVTVNGKVINAPSYLVLKDEESTIEFKMKSGFANEAHPERIQPEAPKKEKQFKKNEEQEDVEIVTITDGEDDE